MMPSDNNDKAEVSSIASGAPLLANKSTKEKTKNGKTGGKSTGNDDGKQSDVSRLGTSLESGSTNNDSLLRKKKSQKPDIFENPKAFPMFGPNAGVL